MSHPALSGFTEPQLESLFRGDVAVRALPVADHFDKLFPQEKEPLCNAVLKRRQEFSTGRICARSAMLALGHGEGPVLSGDKREPLWPQGVIGSISHSGKCCLAALSCDPKLLSLGIDIETREGIKPGVRDLVCTQEDLEGLGAERGNPEWWKLIFSAKESIYKALYPLLQRWIGFSQASLSFDFSTGTYNAILDPSLMLPHGKGPELTGRFLLSDDYIFTCLDIPR